MVSRQREVSSANYGSGGWMHWPSFEDYCFQFRRLLGAAQEGASTISECFLTATRITPGDEESWYREWKRIADISKKRGDCARERGDFETAKANWLRASNYYRTSEYFLAPKDERGRSAIEYMKKCSQLYLKHLTPEGEIVKIPHGADFIRGYFLRAPKAPAKAPVVLCFGGPDEFKDDQLYKMPRHAFGRNLSLLLIDLPGQGGAARREKFMGHHDEELQISACVDYLLERGDIDETRIVLYGDGLGGSYASRSAVLDGRFAAVVCDGGIWDQKEKWLSSKWFFDAAEESGPSGRPNIPQRFIAEKIECPCLVTVGEHDFIHVKDAVGMYNSCLKAGAKIELKIFSAEETAASHGQVDNPTLGKEFIFDWIVTNIGFKAPENLHSGLSPEPALHPAMARIL